VDRAIDCFRRSGADSLVSVLPVPHEFNPHWTFEPAANGFLKIATGDETIIPRRQELPPAYFRDGSVYITRVDILKIHGSLYGKSIAYIVSDTSLYVNIDTPEDWEKAEKLIFQNKVVLPSK
jgi:CMP-N-acetylneuraminic acid synthetase